MSTPETTTPKTEPTPAPANDEIQLTNDGGVKKLILRPGTGDCPKPNSTITGLQ